MWDLEIFFSQTQPAEKEFGCPFLRASRDCRGNEQSTEKGKIHQQRRCRKNGAPFLHTQECIHFAFSHRIAPLLTSCDGVRVSPLRFYPLPPALFSPTL